MIMPRSWGSVQRLAATQLNSCGEPRKVGRGIETHALGLPDGAAYHAPRDHTGINSGQHRVVQQRLTLDGGSPHLAAA